LFWPANCNLSSAPPMADVSNTEKVTTDWLSR
jgi:hypothetical protein